MEPKPIPPRTRKGSSLNGETKPRPKPKPRTRTAKATGLNLNAVNAVNLNAVNDKPEKRRTPKKPRRREQATDGLSVGERVVKRRQLAEVQREIEEISRKLETEMSLYKIVELRKELKIKEGKRDELYKETQNGDKNVVNMDKVEKTLTLMQRRAENQVTRKQRKEEKQERERVAKLLTRDPLHVELKLSLTDRKKKNTERIENLQRAKIRNEFARASRYIEQIHSQEANDKKTLEDEKAAYLLKQMATNWENPEAKKERKKQSVMEAKQKGFYSQLASNGNAPNELKEMMVKPKQKPRPKPKPRKRFGLF
jgi:hypothetical protein